MIAISEASEYFYNRANDSKAEWHQVMADLKARPLARCRIDGKLIINPNGNSRSEREVYADPALKSERGPQVKRTRTKSDRRGKSKSPDAPGEWEWPELIVAMCEKLGVSRSKLADRLGTGRASVNGWVRGVCRPSMEYQEGLLEIASELGLIEEAG